MRFKLLIENVKHHFIISFLLWISLSFLFAMFLIQLEYVNFIARYNQEEYLYKNNYFDIVIQSTTGLSTYGSKEFRDEYKECAAFARVSVLGECKETSTILTIYEGKIDQNDKKYNYQYAFHFDAKLDERQTIITKELANQLQASIGDTIDVHIGEKTYSYDIINIVENEGFFEKNAMLTCGTTISKEFLYLPTLSNVIYIKLNQLSDADSVYQNLNKTYEAYTVMNHRDIEYFKSMVTTDPKVYIAITILILFCLFLLIRKIYVKKLKKQQELMSRFQFSYYQTYNYLARSILFILSYFLAIIIVQLFFSITSRFYTHSFSYQLRGISYLSLLVFAGMIYILLLIKVKIKKFHNHRVYIVPFLGILIMLEVYTLWSHNIPVFSLILVLLIISFIGICLHCMSKGFKTIKSFLKRIYLYDLGKHSSIEKLILGLYIIIACFFSILISSLTYYNSGIAKISSMFKIKNVVIAEQELAYDRIGVYDFIRVNDGQKDYEIDTVLGLDALQIETYTDIVLTDKEKEQFERQDIDSIILPLYFRNKLRCQVGDTLEVKCPGDVGVKQYRIVKFIDGIYWKVAIVNHNDNMMNGYLINDDVSTLKNNLSKTKYTMMNVEQQVLTIQSFYQTNIQQVSIMLLFIMFIFVFFMFYLVYIDFETKEQSIKKLNILGVSNQELIQLNVFKMMLHMIITFVLSILLSSVVTYFFDDIASIFRTTFYVRFDIKYVCLSSILMLICLGLGTLYTIYIMLKTNKINEI